MDLAVGSVLVRGSGHHYVLHKHAMDDGLCSSMWQCMRDTGSKVSSLLWVVANLSPQL